LSYNAYIYGNVTRKVPIELSYTNKNTFSQNQNRKVKQILSGRWYQREREEIRKE
jgi:hypothetical protein